MNNGRISWGLFNTLPNCHIKGDLLNGLITEPTRKWKSSMSIQRVPIQGLFIFQPIPLQRMRFNSALSVNHFIVFYCSINTIVRTKILACFKRLHVESISNQFDTIIKRIAYITSLRKILLLKDNAENQLFKSSFIQ